MQTKKLSVLMLNLIVWNITVDRYKNGFALNNQQELIFPQTKVKQGFYQNDLIRY